MTDYDGGVFFSYDPLKTSGDTILDFFNGYNGSSPVGNMMQATNGMFFGMTPQGGKPGYGIIFRYDPATDKDTTVYNFNDTNGGTPHASLIQGMNGLLYGTTYSGGGSTSDSNNGVIFSFDPNTYHYTKLLAFNNTNGQNPNSSLLQVGNNLYGVCLNGGAGTDGVLFLYDLATGNDSVLYSFTGSEGAEPIGTPILVSDSILMGMTQAAGSKGDGLIYSYNLHTGIISVVYNFNNSSGTEPNGSLLLYGGLVYGMTEGGGTDGFGTMFSFNPNNDNLSVLINFNGAQNGAGGYGSLIHADDGKLYGMTNSGGNNNGGVIYSYDTTTDTDSVLVYFNINKYIGGSHGDLYEGLSALVFTTNNKCYGDSLGTAALHIRGGAYPLKYIWSNGDSTDSVSKLPAGNYSVKITDIDGRGVNLNITITQPTRLKDSILKAINEKCYGQSNGSIVTTGAKGGTKPYMYQWSPGSQSDTAIFNLIAGTYTFTLIDSNKCIDSLVAVIAQPELLIDSIITYNNVLCSGLKTGSAVVGVIGGTRPYSYQWTNSTNDSLVNNIGAGSYTCQVKDTNGCIASTNVTITSPPPIIDSTMFTSTPCTKSTGSVGITYVAGGVPPYTFLWTPGSINDTNIMDTALPSGLYSCIITDSNKCQINASVFIPNTGGPKDSVLSQTNEACFGQCIGTALVRVTGGKLPYTFSWSPSSGGTDTVANGLCAGTYTFAAKDSTGCINTAIIKITQPAELMDSIADTSNVSCFGLSNGSIKIGIKGGVVPYSYAWTNLVSIDTVADNLPIGTYTFNATDFNNCPAPTVVISITSPGALVVDTLSTPTKCGTSNGSVLVNVSGGVAPYVYAWSPISNTNSFVNGLQGNTIYSCTITDAHSCISKVNITVVDTGGPKANVVANSQIKCFGDSTGSAIAYAITGDAPFQYSWSPVGGTNAFAIDLGAGAYSCTITDSTGCKGAASIVIPQPTLMTGTISTIGVCNSFITGGSATISVSGGVPPYTYLWSDSSTNDSVANVGPGAYLCTVTDSNKCKIYPTCSIIPASPLSIDSIVSHPATYSGGYNNGWVQVYPAGGIPQGDSTYYLFVWDNAQTTDSISGLDTGVYHVCVTTNYCANQSICDSVVVVTGISVLNNTNSKINVYPIPSNGNFTVELPELGYVTIKIYDEMGRVCLERKENTVSQINMYFIDIANMANGVYTMQIINNENTFTRKLELQR